MYAYGNWFPIDKIYTIDGIEYRSWPKNPIYLISKEGNIINHRYGDFPVKRRKKHNGKHSVRLSLRGSQRFFDAEDLIREAWTEEELKPKPKEAVDFTSEDAILMNTIRDRISDIIVDRTFIIIFDSKSKDNPVSNFTMSTDNELSPNDAIDMLDKGIDSEKKVLGKSTKMAPESVFKKAWKALGCNHSLWRMPDVMIEDGYEISRDHHEASAVCCTCGKKVIFDITRLEYNHMSNDRPWPYMQERIHDR